jgi:hypothetical protein
MYVFFSTVYSWSCASILLYAHPTIFVQQISICLHEKHRKNCFDEITKKKKNAKENIYEMQNAFFIKIDYEV